MGYVLSPISTVAEEIYTKTKAKQLVSESIKGQYGIHRDVIVGLGVVFSVA